MVDALRSVEESVDGLLQLVRLTRAMLDASRAVALDGLTDHVGLLCAKVMDLPPDQGRAMRPRLLLLLTDVDALTGAVRSHDPHRQKADPCSSNRQTSW